MNRLLQRYHDARSLPWWPRAEWTPGDPPAPSPDQVPLGDPAPPLDAPAKDPA
jgi:hypothetical protein